MPLTISGDTPNFSAATITTGTITTGTITTATITTGTVTTLNAPSGVLATQNGMTGIAKAWVNFNGSTSTIFASFNVSSITRNATADYTVTYTTAMPSANYCVLAPNTPANTTGTSQISMINAPNSSPFYQAPTTTTCRVSWYLSTSTLGSTDVLNASVVVIGA